MLPLSVAACPTDRVLPLVTGHVRIEGCDSSWTLLPPEEIFEKTVNGDGWDVCEMSLSSYVILAERGEADYAALPVFLSRAFRHAHVLVRAESDLRGFGELRGRRIGVPEYQLTALVWLRGIMSDHHGVSVTDVDWITGGVERPGRREKIPLLLPPSIRVAPAPSDRDLLSMLRSGDLDAVMAPRLPVAGASLLPGLRRLLEDPEAAERAYFANDHIFPMMHVAVVRKSLIRSNPWLPAALQRAFEAAKGIGQAWLADTAVPAVMLPWLPQRVAEAEAQLGVDGWTYGLDANRHALTTFLRYMREQGLIASQLSLTALFEEGNGPC